MPQDSAQAANSGNETRRRFLRSEAQPLFWWSMGTTQRAAFQRLVKWLCESLKEFDQPTVSLNSRAFFEAQLNRRNKTFTVSGERGTGKLSMLHTLARATTESVASTWVGAQRTGFTKHNPGVDFFDAHELSFLEASLQHLQGRLVWLDVLDMEVQRSHTNFLAAILTRVEATVERILGNHSTDPYLLRHTNSKAEKALHDLRKLCSEVSAAWDGNLQARSANIDLDTYASEEMRAERTRLDIAQRFAMVLEQLARDLPWSNGIKNPLFVLPVDDFDLHPTRCVELLQLIRMLHYSPCGTRLVSIILGDINSAKKMLKIEYAGELSRMGNIRLQVDSLDRLYHAEAREYATDAIRKLLPHAQTVKLTALSPNDLFNFKPDPSLHSIAELLARIPYTLQKSHFGRDRSNANSVPRIQSLLDFLMNGPFDNQVTRDEDLKKPLAEIHVGAVDRWMVDGKVNVERSGYSMTRNCFMPPREAVDLWHQLAEVVPDQALSLEQVHQLRIATDTQKNQWDDNKARKLMVELYQQALEKDSEVSALLDHQPLGSQLLTYFKDSNSNREQEAAWSSGDDIFQTKCQISSNCQLVPKSLGLPTLVASLSAEWKVQVDATDYSSRDSLSGTKTAETRVLKTLAPRTMGFFMLTHDLFILDDQNRNVRRSAPSSDVVSMVAAKWRTGIGINDFCNVPWLAPPFRSFWAWDHFKSIWHEYVRRIESSLLGTEEVCRQMAFRWISLGVAAIETRGIDHKFFNGSDAVAKENDWRKLGNQVNRMAEELLAYDGHHTDGSTSDEQRLDAQKAFLIPLAKPWIQHIILLLAPESGVPLQENILQLFLDARGKLAAFALSETNRIDLLNRRMKCAAKMIRNGGEDVARRLFLQHQDSVSLSHQTDPIEKGIRWRQRCTELFDFLKVNGKLLEIVNTGRQVRSTDEQYLSAFLDELATGTDSPELSGELERSRANCVILRAIQRRAANDPHLDSLLKGEFLGDRPQELINEVLNSVDVAIEPNRVVAAWVPKAGWIFNQLLDGRLSLDEHWEEVQRLANARID